MSVAQIIVKVALCRILGCTPVNCGLMLLALGAQVCCFSSAEAGLERCEVCPDISEATFPGKSASGWFLLLSGLDTGRQTQLHAQVVLCERAGQFGSCLACLKMLLRVFRVCG